MEKWMIVYLLPLEVWMDILCFPWISRSEFGQLVARIGNFKFAEHAQFYLHEWGKHTLRYKSFSGFGVHDCSEFLQTAMPENIKSFESFEIEHFDNQVFNFFCRIQNLLTANTKLDIRYIYVQNLDEDDTANQLGNARFILGHLLPLIDGVHKVKTDYRMLPMVKTSMCEKFNNIKELNVTFTRFVQSVMQTIMEWLTTSNNENGQKLLQLWSGNKEIAQQVLDTIREQFVEATEPSTFVVILYYHCDFPAFNCENAIGEELCGTRNVNIHGKFKIFRHQANSAQLVDGNKEKVGMRCQSRYIRFWEPSIGHENIFALPNLDEADNEEKEDEDEKPSTSKKRRISK